MCVWLKVVVDRSEGETKKYKRIANFSLKSTILHTLIHKIATWWTLVAIKRMIKVFIIIKNSC